MHGANLSSCEGRVVVEEVGEISAAWPLTSGYGASKFLARDVENRISDSVEYMLKVQLRNACG